MKTISIPYYTSTLDLHVDEANLKAVVTAKMHEYKAGKTEVELVHEALEHPIASPRLRDLAKGKQKVVLVTSDHTRAVPSKITLPILLDEIRQGNPDADITILIATGLHRPTTEEEQRRMFGDAIVDHEKIAINNAFDPDQFIHMGVLPSGADFNVNKLAAECDLLVTEGFIEPHFFAGFSGGRKSILPGICSQETVNENHSYKAISSPYANTGVLEHNPIHEDMVCAARAVNVQFIFNVALNGEKMKPAAIIAGLNEIGGRNGIGLYDVVENRLVGMKSRGVYETPGGTILYKAHEVLETLTLDKLTAHKKRELAITFGELVYDGQWFSPLRKALSAFVTSTQEHVTGKVRLELYKGNLINAGVWSPYSLYREDIATFAAGGDYKQSDATGFISIYGLPTKVQAIVNSEKEGL